MALNESVPRATSPLPEINQIVSPSSIFREIVQSSSPMYIQLLLGVAPYPRTYPETGVFQSSCIAINPHYHVVPLAITEDWVNNNITTDLKITYNDDGSVLFGEIQTNIDNETNENTNNEKKESNSNLNVPIAIGVGAIIGIGIAVILFKKRK